MIDEALSNDLWTALEALDRYREYSMKDATQGGVTIQTFTIRVRRENGRVENRRVYSRIVRTSTGSVLYDQLEDIKRKQVDAITSGSILPPDLPISPERSNKLLIAALKEQEEIDERIYGVTTGG